MIRRIIVTILLLIALTPRDAEAAKVSVLIDFDPKSAEQTVIVESIAVDYRDRLYTVVFIGATAYVSNVDTPRRDNLAADGKTSIDGIGASIIKIEQ